MSLTHKTFAITRNVPTEDRRADRVAQHLTGASRRQTQGLFDHDCVLVNGEICHEPWRWLTDGDFVDVRYDEQQRYAAIKRPPKYLGFEILYEDAHLIVVDKPAMWLTVPSPKGETNTLVQRVAQYLTRRNRGRVVRVWAVQRLDRGVSGAIVLACDEESTSALRQQFAAHEPHRVYAAIVAGRLARDRGEFRSRLASGDDLRQQSVPDAEEGQLAVTRYVVERRWDDATLVRVQLETGRRNQIRVHFAEDGHPVLGDPTYEPRLAKHPRWTSKRLALHAEELGFQHPFTGQECRFTVARPLEFAEFIAGVKTRVD